MMENGVGFAIKVGIIMTRLSPVEVLALESEPQYHRTHLSDKDRDTYGWMTSLALVRSLNYIIVITVVGA